MSSYEIIVVNTSSSKICFSNKLVLIPKNNEVSKYLNVMIKAVQVALKAKGFNFLRMWIQQYPLIANVQNICNMRRVHYRPYCTLGFNIVLFD